VAQILYLTTIGAFADVGDLCHMVRNLAEYLEQEYSSPGLEDEAKELFEEVMDSLARGGRGSDAEAVAINPCGTQGRERFDRPQTDPPQYIDYQIRADGTCSYCGGEARMQKLPDGDVCQSDRCDHCDEFSLEQTIAWKASHNPPA
jgi:hypothetical protein